MLRRLFTPRWLGALLLAALFSVACYHLGWWQYHRHEAKAERNARLDAHYRADPVPLGTVLTPGGLALEDDWTRVTLTGSYAGGPVYVRNRTNEKQAGYEVLWSLREEQGGPEVVVDRGWVPVSARGANALPPVAAAPTGEVTVTGWVRRGEASRGRDEAPGQLASLNLREAGEALGSPSVLPGLRPARVRAPARRHVPRAPGRAGLPRPQPRPAPRLRLPVVAHDGPGLRPRLVRHPPRAAGGGPGPLPAEAEEGADLGRGGRVGAQAPSRTCSRSSENWVRYSSA